MLSASPLRWLIERNEGRAEEMCIICNMGHDESALNEADKFLGEFAGASRKMKQAVTQMKIVAGVCLPAHRSQYDAAHKAMIRALRAWNRIEELRECPVQHKEPRR